MDNAAQNDRRNDGRNSARNDNDQQDDGAMSDPIDIPDDLPTEFESEAPGAAPLGYDEPIDGDYVPRAGDAHDGHDDDWQAPSQDASAAIAGMEDLGPSNPGPPSLPAGGQGKDDGKRNGRDKKNREVFHIDRAELHKLMQREPPYSLEAEAAVLGALLIDDKMMDEVTDVLSDPEDFYFQRHQTIFRVMMSLHQASQPLDMVYLNQRLKDMNLLEEIGGFEYLSDLLESTPSAITASFYARIVREKAVVRGLMQIAQRIWYDSYHFTGNVADLLESAEQQIFKIAESGETKEVSDLSGLLDTLYEQLMKNDGKALQGIQTGFRDLDTMTSGLHPGDMVIIAARPSMGKTAFAINIAENIALGDDTGEQGPLPVLVFSLEMSKEALAQRMLCSRSGVDSQRVRQNMLSKSDFRDLAIAVGRLSDAPMFIDDTPGLTMLQMRARARRMVARHKIKVIVIDYLQLLASPSNAESRQTAVSDFSRGIKAMGRELGVPVICLSQLNRGPEQRDGHRPRMSDLRESGSIEQDADLVIMLHREAYYHKDDEWQTANPMMLNTAEAIIEKQRNGPTGVVHLHFNSNTTRFTNAARPQSDGYN